MRTDSELLREIARDITIELIRKTGVQSYENAQQTKQLVQRAVEMTKQIQKSFPSK